MPSHRQSRLSVRTLLLAAMALPPIAVLASIPWLKQQPDGLVFLLTGIAATLTIIASFWFAVLHDRTLDEWHRSNARFASQWGWAAGAGLVAFLLALPPFRDFVVSSVGNVAEAAAPDQKIVVLAFTFGFGAVVIAQMLCTILLASGWAYWKSRSPREPS